MNTEPLPQITRADREAAEQDDIFAERTLICGGCGVTFTTTNPRTARCAECNAGLKVRVICPACDLEHTVPILAPTKLCGPCQVDPVMTRMSVESRVNYAQCHADEAWLKLDAALIQASDADRERYDAALEKQAAWPAARWAVAYEAAVARQDGLTPLLIARAAWDTASVALDAAQQVLTVVEEELSQ